MELDFDKEIDTLLRTAGPGKGVLVGDVVSPHLDVDSISAFAENALPENSRLAFVKHFADCDHCRHILSNVISMNSEAAPEAAFAGAPAVIGTTVPWYRRLFLFPNLAYVMGSLVLVFSGLLGYLVLQNAGGGQSSEVSLIEDARSTASGPNAGDEPMYPAAAANSTMNAANKMNTAANMMANASTSNSRSAASNSNSMPVVTGRALDAPSDGFPAERDKDILLDGADSLADTTTTQAAPPPAPIVRELPERQKEVAALGAPKNEKPARDEDESHLAKQKIERKQLQRTDRGPFKSAGPQRNQQNTFPNQVQNKDYEIAVTRTVGGKNFERKQGVWYDTAYRGQGTTNVRRGTDAYRKLDGGLRIIAESLGGVVVTVWKDKAYRIQ